MNDETRVLLIERVAQAMRTADGDHTMGTGALAEVAVEVFEEWMGPVRDGPPCRAFLGEPPCSDPGCYCHGRP